MLTIFTDGASRGNPGPASCGFVVYENDHLLVERGIHLGIQTNNYAEYQGVIKALQWVLENYGNDSPIQFKMDSMLVASQMSGKWKIKHEIIRSLYFTAKNLEKEFPSVTYQHVAREENTEADRMANFALDNA